MPDILQAMRQKLTPAPTVHQLNITPNLPFQWKQGEHLGLTGDTGSGKTTLANLLLHARKYTLALRSKDDDTPLPGARIKSAADFGNRTDIDRYLLNPPYERQLDEFWNALETVWRQSNRKGGWCVYCDELFYLSTSPNLRDRDRKLSDLIDRGLTQGRSKRITMMWGAQRPVQISRFAPTQSTHIISFSCDDDDVKRLAQVCNRQYGDVVNDLKRWEFAWFYRPERQIWRGTVTTLVPLEDAGKEAARMAKMKEGYVSGVKAPLR